MAMAGAAGIQSGVKIAKRWIDGRQRRIKPAMRRVWWRRKRGCRVCRSKSEIGGEAPLSSASRALPRRPGSER